MIARFPRLLALAAVSAVLLTMAFAGAGTVQAAIPDRTFRLLGCDIGDYTCYYTRLGGAPYTYYCNNGYYTCTNGIPDTPPTYSQNVSPYCGDGGGTGCINGSPLYVSTTVNSNGGLSSAVVVTSGFVKAGQNGTPVTNP